MSDAAGDWVLISLDEKLAKRQGVRRACRYRGEFEGLCERGMGSRRCGGPVVPLERPKDTAWRTENSVARGEPRGVHLEAGLWAKAQKAFAANDFKRASTLPQIAVSIRTITRVRMNLGNAYANTGDHAKALGPSAPSADLQRRRGLPFVRRAAPPRSARFPVAAGGRRVRARPRANPECKPAMDALVKLPASPIWRSRDATSLTYVRATAWLEGPRGGVGRARPDRAILLEQLAVTTRSGGDAAVALPRRRSRPRRLPNEKEAERARMGKVAAPSRPAKRDGNPQARRKKERARRGRVELARCLFDEGKTDGAAPSSTRR